MLKRLWLDSLDHIIQLNLAAINVSTFPTSLSCSTINDLNSRWPNKLFHNTVLLQTKWSKVIVEGLAYKERRWSPFGCRPSEKGQVRWQICLVSITLKCKWSLPCMTLYTKQAYTGTAPCLRNVFWWTYEQECWVTCLVMELGRGSTPSQVTASTAILRYGAFVYIILSTKRDAHTKAHFCTHITLTRLGHTDSKLVDLCSYNVSPAEQGLWQSTSDWEGYTTKCKSK